MSRAAWLSLALGLSLGCQGDAPVEQPTPGGNRPPNAQLTAPDSGNEGAMFTFDASASSDPDGNRLTYLWNFGDGAADLVHGAVVGHTYRDDGVYHARVLVFDERGGVDTVTKDVRVANVAPQITLFRIPQYPVGGGITVQMLFDFHDPGLDDTSGAWIFWSRPGGSGEGQGPFLRGDTVEHLFSDPDTYIVSLTVSDKDGASTSRTDTLIIAGHYYAAFDLGTLGGDNSTPVALNDSAHVVGCSATSAGKTHAFVWTGTMSNLSPGHEYSCAQVITNSGVIGGVVRIPTGAFDLHVARWTNRMLEDLGACCGDQVGVVALTSTDLLAGGSEHEWRYHSTFWQNGVRRDLGGLQPSGYASARAMNNRRQIVGFSRVGEVASLPIHHAFIWEAGVMRDLGVLGDYPCPDAPTKQCGESYAFGINNTGVAIGWSTNAQGDVRGVRWANGRVEELGFPQPVAINSAGDIAGDGLPGSPTSGEGYFWRSGAVRTLGSFGGGGTVVAGMNDQSTVVGTTLTPERVPHVFVWDPSYGRMIDLGAGPFGGAQTGVLAIAINSRGDIIGRTVGPCLRAVMDPTWRCEAWAGPSRAVLWKVIR
jgi:probable HAF family extracellular repeat protein